jgi:leucyl-tRNA synthetase
VVQEALELVVLMLSPVVPHICHALWHALGHADAVVDCAWPAVDADALRQDSVTLIVQVNGKLRGKVSVAADAQRDVIEAAVLSEENVCRHIGDQVVKKVIVVPGKLVNVVV